jgi:hypothetical protein
MLQGHPVSHTSEVSVRTIKAKPYFSKGQHCIAFNSIFPITQRKGKAVLLQGWSGPEGSKKLGFPDFRTTAQDGGKVVSITHRPPVPPGNTPGTHFC